MPAACARWQMSSTGKVRAVAEVMWLTKMTLVRGVTPAQSAATMASAVVAGRGMCWRT